jgi:hypothetical protein
MSNNNTSRCKIKAFMALIQVEVFWFVMSYNVVVGYHCSGGSSCFHLQYEVDLDVGEVSRRVRDTYEPIGKSVKPTCERATGRERKEMKRTCLGRHWCKALLGTEL